MLKPWNRNHQICKTLESELGSVSHGAGIGIRNGITSYWNQNYGFWKTLESKSALLYSELESESRVQESYTTLVRMTLDIILQYMYLRVVNAMDIDA